MEKKKLQKEIRVNPELLHIEERAEGEESRMVIEGYPIVFDKEAFIGGDDWGWWEKVDRHAFDETDMSDVVFRYNHNDNFEILARTRNKSLTLSVDDKGVFMHAELIDTNTNRDIYKMVKEKLLTEGSFAFTVTDHKIEGSKNGRPQRTITGIGKLFDVSVCDNGAYGDLTEIYARSRDLVETESAELENPKADEIVRLRNKNALLLMGGKK